MTRILLNSRGLSLSNFCLIIVFFLLSGANSYSYGSLPKFNMYVPSNSIYIGRVHGRSIVNDEDTGLPRWATYNKEGGHTELTDINLERASKGKVVSATFLNNYYLKLSDFKDRYDGEWTLLNTEDYENLRKSEEGFQTQDGTSIIGLPELKKENEQFAIVLPKKSKRFNVNGSRIETIIFPFDVTEEPKIESDTFTVLVDEIGEFIEQSPERIGYLSAFALNEDGEVTLSEEYDQYEGVSTRLFDRKVLNPVEGVRITGENGMAMNQEAYSDIDGKYRLEMRFGCPGGFYQTTTYMDAHLSYGMFNPRGLSSMPYWISFPAIDNCIGYIDPYTGVSMSRNVASVVNFQVAISVLTGTATLWNAEISEDEPTAYHAEQSSDELFEILNDYDGDNILDSTARGIINDEKLFESSAEGDIYGVFLSGSPREDGQPNFTRIMDVEGNTTAQGLVSIVNNEDLRNTDIYAFRESTGELITERIGIPEDEEKLRVIGGHGEGLTADNHFTFTFAIRSPEDMLSMHSKRHDGWEAWQADNKINPDLHSRQSDFIRTGEKIRIVAINRATGYMGSSLATMGGTSGGGDLTVYVPPLVLGPPNLKVWATRKYEPEGLLKDSDKVTKTISNEGAATTGDFLIKVHTEWLDANDMPLPDELQDRGFTGRLVKVVSDDGAFESRITEFPINPGRHMQVVKFSEGDIGKAHFYLQVNGNVEEKENDFSTGAHEGVLEHRPNLYVPVKVPLYNEQETKLNAYLQKKAEAEDEAANGEQDEEDKFKEEPLFDWVYRPELSFSVIDLEVQEILREQEDEEGNTTVSLNVMEDETPTISSADDLIKVMFELAESEYDRITPLDGEQEYIFAVGEQEISITLTEHQNEEKEITFSNLEHLAEIEPEDYLSLRLYLNQDSQNVLWEFAFEYVQLLPSSKDANSDGYVEVSVDDKDLILNAFILGYDKRDPDLKAENNVIWKNKGDGGHLDKTIEVGAKSLFTNTLSFPTYPNAINTVSFELQNGASSKIHTANFKTVAGKPDSVSVTLDGEAAQNGFGNITGTVTILDQFNNPVVDGTPVDITVDGDALIIVDTGLTVNGQIPVRIKGGLNSGSQKLTIKAGSVEHTEGFNIAAIELEIDIPEQVPVNSEVLVEVLAKTNIGIGLSGLKIAIGSSTGKMKDDTLTFTGNIATTKLFTGDAIGAAQIVLIKGSQFSQKSFEVIRENPEIVTAHTLLIGDQLSDGSVSLAVDNDVFEGSAEQIDVPYVVSTTASIVGVPGADEIVELGSLLTPNIEPVLQYPMNHVLMGDVVADQYTKINALAMGGITYVQDSRIGFGNSFEFDGVDDFVKVPALNLLTYTNDVGVVMDIKPNGESGSLFQHSQSSLKVTLESGAIHFSIQTEDGLFTVKSESIGLGEWHRIAAHYKDNKILLQVDGKTFIKEATGSLITQTSTGSSFLLGKDYKGRMDNFKLFDWTAPTLMSFSDGTTRKSVVIGMDGQAQLTVKSNAQLGVVRNKIATNLTAELYRDRLVKYAYAELHDPSNFWDVPISIPDALVPDIITPGGVTLDTSVNEIMVKTTDTVAYGAELTGDFALGLLLGTGSEGMAFKAGELVASMLLIGDIRDAGTQAIFQYSGSAEYDQVTHLLANIGMLTSLASAGGFLAGGVPGALIAVLDGLVGAAKVASKTFNAAAPMSKALGPHLDKLFNKLYSWIFGSGDKPNFEITVTFLEVYIAISVAGDDMVKFFEQAVTTENFEYVLSYIQRLATGLGESVTVNSREDFLKIAYAASSTKHIDAIKKLLDGSIEFGRKNDISPEESGKLFNKAIMALEKDLLTDAQLGNITDHQEVLNALMMGVKYGPQGTDGATDAMVKAATKLKDNAARDAMYNAISRIDWKKLEDAADNPQDMIDALKGNQGPFGYLAISPSAAKAAAMMFEQIAKAQELGLSVLAIEKKIDITNVSGSPIATGRANTREVDLVLKTMDGGKVKYIELKGWTETVTLKDGSQFGAGKWMQNQLDNPGSQIYKDIILFATENSGLKIGAFEGVQWYIKKSAETSLGGASTLTDKVLDGVEKNKDYFSNVMEFNRNAPDYDSIWEEFKDELGDAMSRSGDEFFKFVD